MVAVSRQPDHLDHLTAIPDDASKAIPVAAIYGANGAGKSNLVKALAFLEKLVLRGTDPKKTIGRRPFLLDEESANNPTELSLQFVENGRVYGYGCRVSDNLVDAEWLSLVRDGKEISIFERKTTSELEVTIEAGSVLTDETWGGHAKVLALTKVGALPNQLFLHAIRKNLQEQDQGPIISGALRWFSERLIIIEASAAFASLANLLAEDKLFTEFADEFLRKVATGVDHLRVDTAQVEESLLSHFGNQVPRAIQEMETGDTTIFLKPDGTELIIEKEVGTKVQVRTIISEHVRPDGQRIPFPFSEESDGTMRLTHLLPALHAISQKPGLFVIDEIDRSLHPLLAKGFVRAFLQICGGKGSQLIFTTHETAFLDLDLLRRDEIWFADKKLPQGATELYSLAEYRIRTDLKLDKAYLQGRFEAVPPIEAELPDWVRQIIEELEPKRAFKVEACV